MIVIRLLGIILLLVVAICAWKTTEYFNTLPENNKYKPVLAWDVMLLFIFLVALSVMTVII